MVWSEAVDGAEAVEHVNSAHSPPHLILMDKNMPVMEGIEATRRIRELEARKGWPRAAIDCVSASVFPEDVKEAMGAGCDDVKPKPFYEADLRKIVI